MKIWVGVDVHKESHAVAVLRENGVLHHFRTPSDNLGLLKQFQERGIQISGSHVVICQVVNRKFLLVKIAENIDGACHKTGARRDNIIEVERELTQSTRGSAVFS